MRAKQLIETNARRVISDAIAEVVNAALAYEPRYAPSHITHEGAAELAAELRALVELLEQAAAVLPSSTPAGATFEVIVTTDSMFPEAV